MDIVISSNKKKLDIEMIYEFLRSSYWAENIPRKLVEKSINHSLCFGVYLAPPNQTEQTKQKQIGFARVITDFAVFAYLADVFILPEYRGKGYGRQLISSVMSYPKLAGLRRWQLVTYDAQELYRKFGFENPAYPDHHMEIAIPDIYKKTKTGKNWLADL